MLSVFLSTLAERVTHSWSNDDAYPPEQFVKCIFPSLTFTNFLLQLKDNIEKFFTWFVEEGKATVRLKEPAVDICLSKVRNPTWCNYSLSVTVFISKDWLFCFFYPEHNIQVYEEATSFLFPWKICHARLVDKSHTID